MNTDPKETKEPVAPVGEASLSPLTESDAAFIREKIKERPINRRKLLRRTLITAVLAILFGGVACLSFLLLEPWFSERITPDEEPAVVTFPTSDDEIQPEDLFADDEEIASAQEASVAESIQASIEASEQDRINAAVSSAISRYRPDRDDASSVYRSLKGVAADAERSLVLVRAAETQNDFVGGTVEQGGEAPGLIVADNNVEMLVLTYASILERGANLSITWYGGEISSASLKMRDAEAGLCVLSVPKRSLARTTLDQIAAAGLGSSASSSLTGTPVVAVGSPIGLYRSVCYGVITSEKVSVDRTDRALQVFATDIYGGGDSGGFLLNYSGHVLGVIYPEPLAGVDENRVLAYSISELRRLIEHLVNAVPFAYLGVHGADVTREISASLGIPAGAFVLRTEMDSPAMAAGVQSGDVIVSFNGAPVSSWSDYTAALDSAAPDEEVALSILRQGPDEYLPIQLTMTTEEVNA